MPRGGARNRSGPPADPSSGRSDRRGFSLQALPAKGYTGRVPKFPLLPRNVYYVVDKERHFDEAATKAVAKREAELWRWAWRTPQACAWSMPSEAWRINHIAMWVRTFVICEGSDATAADKNSLHRFSDQVGLTTAGLAEMGWKVEPASESTAPAPASAPSAPDEVGAKRERRLRGAG
jgi:hypothetical protein